MNKIMILLLIIFLAFPHIVSSIKEFTVEETEKVSLQANAADPDANKLATTYTPPLDEKGEWQTTYGDAGEYTATITVSDGITNVSEDVLINVKKKEEPPRIESFIPSQFALSINEGNSIDFRVLASDLNKDGLAYEWLVDDKKAKDGREFSYEATYKDAGNHKIIAVVSDRTLSASNEWNVDIANVNVEMLLNGIKDVSVNENESARLKLPDFEKYLGTWITNQYVWDDDYGSDESVSVLTRVEKKEIISYEWV